MMTVNQDVDLQVIVSGVVDSRTVEYIRTRIRGLARYTDHAIVHARVNVTEHADRAVSRAFLAQANIGVGRQLVRAQVAATSLHEAIDALYERLRRQLTAHAEHWEARRGGFARPGEWRHASAPSQRADYFPRPQGEREIVRHKSLAIPLSTVDEAAFDMEMLDYRFHLFTERGTGQDSVLYETDHGRLRLAQIDPQPDQIAAARVAFEVSPQPAARLTVADAIRRLDLSGLPFLFFRQESDRDAGPGRGCVLYRRYDGHYGLISPV